MDVSELISSGGMLARYLAGLWTIATVIVAIVLWSLGLLPVLWRLGMGLARRRVAIFARDANLAELRHLLTDSKLFRASRIIDVPGIGSIGRAEEASVFLVQWSDWEEHVAEILDNKADNVALIVFARPGSVPPEQLANLDRHRNVVLVNFRGRLLNDLVTSMITTSYAKK